MRSVEMKFLFEGIIFSSHLFIEKIISNSFNRYEFTVSFITKYLISKYRDCYFMVWENNGFKQLYTMNEKERELVEILQNAIRSVFHDIKNFSTEQNEVALSYGF